MWFKMAMSSSLKSDGDACPMETQRLYGAIEFKIQLLTNNQLATILILI